MCKAVRWAAATLAGNEKRAVIGCSRPRLLGSNLTSARAAAAGERASFQRRASTNRHDR